MIYNIPEPTKPAVHFYLYKQLLGSELVTLHELQTMVFLQTKQGREHIYYYP